MTAAECASAIAAVRALVEGLSDIDLLAVGEMGIGNSTAASAITAALLSQDVASVVGRGTGVGSQTRARKTAVVNDALRVHGPALSDPDEVLRRLGALRSRGWSARSRSGGMSTWSTIAPGASLRISEDVSRWNTPTTAGSYNLQCLFDLALHVPREGFSMTYAHERRERRLETTLAVEIAVP